MNEKTQDRKSTAAECPFSENLIDYLDPELPVLRRLRIQLHLRRCPQCRQALQEMERIGAEMERLGAMDAVLAPETRERLIDSLKQVQPDVPDTHEPDRAKPLPLWKQRPLLVFGGGGLTVAASLLIFMTLYNPASNMLVSPEASTAQTAAVGVASSQDMSKKMVAEAPPAVAETMMKSITRTERAPVAAGVPPGIPGPAIAGNGPAAPPAADVAAGLALYGDAPNGSQRRGAGQKAVAAAGQAGVLSAVGGDGMGVVGGSERQVAQAVRIPSTESTRADANTVSGLPEERQVHREANIGVAVGSVEQADNQIITLVESGGGYVASNNLNTDESGFKYAELTLKVPVKDFQTVLAEIGKLGELRSKSLSGEDVTDKVSDATSDEQVLIDETQKLSGKLKSGGMSEKQTARTDAELRETRLQLGRTRARLGMLRKLSSLSTIQVSLTEKAKKQAIKPEETGFLHDMKETNRAAMTAFQSAVRVPIVMIVWVLAFSPLWIPLILAYRWASLKNRAQR